MLMVVPLIFVAIAAVVAWSNGLRGWAMAIVGVALAVLVLLGR